MSNQSAPPYFNIASNTALASLDIPVVTSDFSKIAQACSQGRTDLINRDFKASNDKSLRLFSTWEITKYLIPVAPAHFRRVLRSNPDLPQGQSETDGGAKWFTFDEVLQLRAYFGAQGSKTKEYLPYRPPALPARIVTVANVKSGTGKTSTAAHLAMSAALDGYKVLMIDLDSQGSMTSILNGKITDEWQTVFPLVARHYAGHLRTENQHRLNRGEAPLPFDNTLTKALEGSASDIIHPTHWPNIDLIGAQLNLSWSEFQIPNWRMTTRSWKPWDALADMLKADAVLEAYDLIVLDTPPALGYLTINGLVAADILVVPTGASFDEFESTGRFFDMLHSAFQSIEEDENMAARALGRDELHFQWDAVQTVITRYDASRQAETAGLMQASLGRHLSPYRQDFTELLGQTSENVHSVYETDYRDFNREVYARARASFDDTYAAFKRLFLGSWRREEIAAEKANRLAGGQPQ